jgi:hypothetical protein
VLFYYATLLHKRQSDFFNLSFRAKSSIFAEEEDLDEEDEEEKDDSCGVNKVQRKEGAF